MYGEVEKIWSVRCREDRRMVGYWDLREDLRRLFVGKDRIEIREVAQ
jgi:hypothetical protein